MRTDVEVGKRVYARCINSIINTKIICFFSNNMTRKKKFGIISGVIGTILIIVAVVVPTTLILSREANNTITTSNARLKTHSALSRRNDVSKLPPNYLFIQFYSLVNPYKNIIFCEKSSPLCKKNESEKKFKKLTLDSSSSTPITLRSTLIKK